MKTNRLIFFAFLIFAGANLFAQAATPADTLFSANKSLNPYRLRDVVNLGTGAYMNAISGTNYNLGLEIGYMWKTGDAPEMSLSTDYIGKRKDYRYGFALGGQYFKNEYILKNNLFYNSKGTGIYTKAIFGSPVLLNFVSFGCHLKFMYVIPDGSSGHNIKRNRMVYGYGFDVEFWITEDENVTIGFTDESDAFFTDIKDSIYPSEIRFVFGFKSFF